MFDPQKVQTFLVTANGSEKIEDSVGAVNLSPETVDMFTSGVMVLAPVYRKNEDESRTLLFFTPMLMPSRKLA